MLLPNSCNNTTLSASNIKLTFRQWGTEDYWCLGCGIKLWILNNQYDLLEFLLCDSVMLKLWNAGNQLFYLKYSYHHPLASVTGGGHTTIVICLSYTTAHRWQEQCKLSNALMLKSMAMISKAFRYSHQWLWRLLCCLVTCDTMLLGRQVTPKRFLFPTTKCNNQQKYQSYHLLSTIYFQ